MSRKIIVNSIVFFGHLWHLIILRCLELPKGSTRLKPSCATSLPITLARHHCQQHLPDILASHNFEMPGSSKGFHKTETITRDIIANNHRAASLPTTIAPNYTHTHSPNTIHFFRFYYYHYSLLLSEWTKSHLVACPPWGYLLYARPNHRGNPVDEIWLQDLWQCCFGISLEVKPALGFYFKYNMKEFPSYNWEKE